MCVNIFTRNVPIIIPLVAANKIYRQKPSTVSTYNENRPVDELLFSVVAMRGSRGVFTSYCSSHNTLYGSNRPTYCSLHSPREPSFSILLVFIVRLIFVSKLVFVLLLVRVYQCAFQTLIYALAGIHMHSAYLWGNFAPVHPHRSINKRARHPHSPIHSLSRKPDPRRPYTRGRIIYRCSPPSYPPLSFSSLSISSFRDFI